MKKYFLMKLFLVVFGLGSSVNAGAQDHATSDDVSEKADGRAACDDMLSSFNSGADTVSKRINTILKKIFEINSLLELREVQGEIAGYSHAWSQKVEILRRSGLVSDKEVATSALIAETQKLFTALVKETSASKEEFSVIYIKSILLNAEAGLSLDNDFQVLVNGVKSRSSSNFERLKKLASIAASLQKELWIPASIRAKLALALWHKNQDVAADPLAYLPFIFKNLPTNTTRSQLMAAYLETYFPDNYDSYYGQFTFVYADILASSDALTKERVSEFLRISSEINEYGTEVSGIKTAGAIWEGRFTDAEFNRLFEYFKQHVGYSKSSQLVDFTLNYLLKRQPGQTPESLINFYQGLYSRLYDGPSRKIALLCVEFNCLSQDVEKYIQIANDIESSSPIYSKHVGTVLKSVIAQGATAKVVQRISVIIKILNDAGLAHYGSSFFAAVVDAVNSKLMTDKQIGQFLQAFETLRQVKHMDYYADMVPLTKGLVELGFSIDIAQKLKAAFEAQRELGIYNTAAAKNAVTIVKAQLKVNK